MSYAYIRTYTSPDHSMRETIWAHVGAYSTLSGAKSTIKGWEQSEPDHWYAEREEHGTIVHYTIRRIPIE